MNKFFIAYEDITALTLSLLLPLLLTVYFKRRAGIRLRSIPVYFFLLGPLGVLTFIFFHLLENSYSAINSAISGHFTYTFRFYSLILFGAVVAYVAALHLKACVGKCAGKPIGNRSFFLPVFLMLLITAPLFPITPLAIVPFFCCTVSVLSLPFVYRKRWQQAAGVQQEWAGRVDVHSTVVEALSQP